MNSSSVGTRCGTQSFHVFCMTCATYETKEAAKTWISLWKLCLLPIKVSNIQPQLERLIAKNYFLNVSAKLAYKAYVRAYESHSLKQVYISALWHYPVYHFWNLAIYTRKFLIWFMRWNYFCTWNFSSQHFILTSLDIRRPNPWPGGCREVIWVLGAAAYWHRRRIQQKGQQGKEEGDFQERSPQDQDLQARNARKRKGEREVHALRLVYNDMI